ncbi:MAG: relaxase/mobilization nuclease domain-containing protein [Lachnospiraceae bacterium]|nr:relaxase/mobilization nuclease domain-containing protein [Lachnospiraceae bacterium]
MKEWLVSRLFNGEHPDLYLYANNVAASCKVIKANGKSKEFWKKRNNRYRSVDDVLSCLLYITGENSKEKKSEIRYIILRGICMDLTLAAEQICIVNSFYRKKKGKYPKIHHIIISPPWYDNDLDKVINAAKAISDHLFTRFQLCCAVHYDGHSYHIHIAFNTRSYKDGSPWIRTNGSWIENKECYYREVWILKELFYNNYR